MKQIKLFLIVLAIFIVSSSAWAQKGSGCPDDLVPKLSENKNWGYADLFGHWVIEPIYSKVSLFVEGKAVVQKGILCGVIDCEGNVVLQCKYEKLTHFRNGKVWAMEKGLWGLVGAKGQIFQTPQYSEINPIANSELAWIKKNNQWGLFNEERNNFTCTPQFDIAQIMSPNASLVKKGTVFGVLNHVNCGYLLPLELTRVKKIAPHDIIFEQKKQWGVFNELGKIILNPEYDSIFIQEDILYVNKGGKYGLYTLTGKKILNVEYDYIGTLSEGYFSIKLNGKYGYCTRLGKVYIKPTYEEVKPFQNKRAIVKKGGKWGVVDVSNKVILPFEFESINAIGNGLLYSIAQNGKFYFYSAGFKKITEESFESIFASDTVTAIRVFNNNLYRYYNPQAKAYLSANTYDYADAFQKGFAIVGTNGKKGLIDLNGKAILPIQYDAIVADKFQAKTIFRTLLNSKEGISDASGKTIIANEYDKLLPALPNYIKVIKNGKYGILRTSGEVVTEAIYDYMSTVDNLPNAPEWPAIVSLKGKLGLLNEKGEEIYPFKAKELAYVGNNLYATKEGKELMLLSTLGKATVIKYDEVTVFGDGLAAVRKAEKWGYINTGGEERIKVLYDQAEPFMYKMAAVKTKGKWGIIDRMGKTVIPFEYDDYKLDTDGARKLSKDGKSYLLLPNGTFE